MFSRTNMRARTATDVALEDVLERARPCLGNSVQSYRTDVMVRAAAERMRLLGESDPLRYGALLLGGGDESAALARALQIGVTSFFREPSSLELVAHAVFLSWVRSLPHTGPLRLWVPGCATGEEAYSLAMLAYESAEVVGRPLDLQVFASDVDEHALLIARRGFYPRGIEREVSSEHLARFFVRSGDGYRVVRSLRRRVAFLRHDVRERPPLTRLDLISCRNLLFYFDVPTRERILRTMSSALRRPGHLLLSRTENVGGMVTHYAPIGSRTGLYAVRGQYPMAERTADERDATAFAHTEAASVSELGLLNQELAARDRQRGLLEASLRALLVRLRGARVLIDARASVCEVHGLEDAGLPPLSPGSSLARYGRELEAPELADVVARCLREGSTVRYTLPLGRWQGRTLAIEPIEEDGGLVRLGAWLEFDPVKGVP